MILARIFTNIYKEGGIILIDAKGQKYICGNPKKEKPPSYKLKHPFLLAKLRLQQLKLPFEIYSPCDLIAYFFI